MLLLDLVEDVGVASHARFASELLNALLRLEQVINGHVGARLEKSELALEIIKLHLGIVDALNELIRQLSMIPLRKRLAVAETVLILSLLRGGPGLVDYPFGFSRQYAECVAARDEHVVVAIELVDE